jgi:hypothetical protein
MKFTTIDNVTQSCGGDGLTPAQRNLLRKFMAIDDVGRDTVLDTLEFEYEMAVKKRRPQLRLVVGGAA